MSADPVDLEGAIAKLTQTAISKIDALAKENAELRAENELLRFQATLNKQIIEGMHRG